MTAIILPTEERVANMLKRDQSTLPMRWSAEDGGAYRDAGRQQCGGF